MVEKPRIYTFPFDGYWVDVGTVDAYWQTSMELISGQSKLESVRSELGDPYPQRGARRRPRSGPQGSIHESMICNGCIVRGQVITFGAVAGGIRLARAPWCARASS